MTKEFGIDIIQSFWMRLKCFLVLFFFFLKREMKTYASVEEG